MNRIASRVPSRKGWKPALLISLAVVLAVSLMRCTSTTSPPASGPDPLTRRKIDAHYHLGGEGFIEETVANAEKYNTIYLTSVPYEKISVLKAAQEKHPGVFIGEGRIQLDDPDAVKKIEEFHQAGFKAIGELTKPLKRFDDPAYFPIYEKAQELGLHVMFHTGIVNWRINRAEFSGMDRMRPAYLDIIMRRFPKLTIQGAHLGNPWY
ncbi:MAG: amidohydrolase family protein, partial [bacterium]